MKAADAQTIASFLLSTFEFELPITLKVLAAVPPDKLDYRPDPMSKSALGLLRHLALEDEWLLTAVAEGHFTPQPDDSDACGVMTPAEASARYQERIPAVLARIKALPGEALIAEVDMLGFARMPAIGFLSLALRHSAHHRGQLSAYLRAMGGKVPAIYGPSADTVAITA